MALLLFATFTTTAVASTSLLVVSFQVQASPYDRKSKPS